MKEIRIGENESGQRLDKFLLKYMSRAPKSFIYKMLRKKNITLNGKKAQGNEQLRQGDAVKLFLSDDTIGKFSETRTAGYAETELDILYEDKHTIFINKPAGMLSQKAAAEDVSLVEHLIAYLLKTGQISEEALATFRPSVCNRLDRNTSGIVAAGKSLAALQQLSAMFRERSLKKYYLCLVHGRVTEARRISGFLSKDERTNRVRVQRAGERRSPQKEEARIETEYRPLRSGDGVTLLEVHLITGKTHQIRAHLAAEGHPIIGDYKYGMRSVNDSFKREYGLSTQLLHSCRLCFPECTGALSNLSGREITAPVPDLFRRICREKGVM